MANDIIDSVSGHVTDLLVSRACYYQKA